MQRDHRRVLLLAPEPAAGLGLDHPRLAVVDGEPALEGRVDVVRALERAVDGHPAVLGRHRDHRVVLDVQLLLVADAVLALEDRGRRPRTRRPGRRWPARTRRTRGPTSSGSKTAGSGSVRGVHGGRAPPGASPDRARRGGPAARRGGWISPPTGTRIGWSSLIELTMLSPGMSAAVTTTTVDQSKAGSRSSATNRACASVERMVAPNQAPGKTRSSAYFAAPVSLAGPSRRSGPAPRARPGAIVPGWMMTASGDSVRLVRSGKGRPPSRLTLSPAVAPTGASAMFAPDRTGPHRPVTSSTTNWSGDPPDSCRCPGWAACSPSGAQLASRHRPRTAR